MTEGSATLETPAEIKDVVFLKIFPGIVALAPDLFHGIHKANAQALVLQGYATGTIPSGLFPFIERYTEEGGLVFVLSDNPGDKRGPSRMRYQTQADAAAIGVTLLKEVNSNDAPEVLSAIQAEINNGKTGEQLKEAIIAKFGTPPPVRNDKTTS